MEVWPVLYCEYLERYKPDQKEAMGNRNRFLRIGFILMAFGIFSFLAILGRPSFSSIRGVAVVHLIGIGMCFGGAIIALVVHYRNRPSS
jgi:hypothetical protein